MDNLNSTERSIYKKYGRDKTFKYIWDVYAEMEFVVNFSSQEYEGLNPGEFRFNYASWSERLNTTKKKMQRAIKELVENGVIIQVIKGYKGNDSVYYLTRFNVQNEDTNKDTNKDNNEDTNKDTNKPSKIESLDHIKDTNKDMNKDNNGDKKKVHTSKNNNLSILSKNNNLSKKRTEIDEIVDNYTGNEILKKSIYDFIKMRKANKRTITSEGIRSILYELDKLASDDIKKVEILRKSVMNSWQGIYPLGEKKSITNNLRFNNFEQRVYDYEDLERKLLGWDKED